MICCVYKQLILKQHGSMGVLRVYKQLILEQHGGIGVLRAVKYEYNFCFQEALAVPQYPWGIGFKTPFRYQNPQMLQCPI